MTGLYSTIGVTLALLLILAILLLGVLAWRRQRRERPADARPDQQVAKVNGGGGGPPEPP